MQYQMAKERWCQSQHAWSDPLLSQIYLHRLVQVFVMLYSENRDQCVSFSDTVLSNNNNAQPSTISCTSISHLQQQ